MRVSSIWWNGFVTTCCTSFANFVKHFMSVHTSLRLYKIIPKHQKCTRTVKCKSKGKREKLKCAVGRGQDRARIPRKRSSRSWWMTLFAVLRPHLHAHISARPRRLNNVETLVLSLFFFFFLANIFGIDLFIHNSIPFYLHSAGLRCPPTASSNIIPNPHRRNRWHLTPF